MSKVKFCPTFLGSLNANLKNVCTFLKCDMPSEMAEFETLKVKLKAFAENAMASDNIESIQTANRLVTAYKQVYEKATAQYNSYLRQLDETKNSLKELVDSF